MDIKKYVIGIFCMALLSCCKEDDHLLCYGHHDEIEGDITLAGALGDGVTDCSKVINGMIDALPDEGGVIVIPEGIFVLDAPIQVSKNNVVIKGLNPGFRSNIDVDQIDDLLGPGGGSKLVIRNTETAIQLANAGISGLCVKDLLITGGKENKGTGILLDKSNSQCKIDNVIGINLMTGVQAVQSKGLSVTNSWICEVRNSISLKDGEGNSIQDCQLGAQPAGNTCCASGESNLSFSRNHVYPDGASNLILTDCRNSVVSNNNFKSFYVGILDVTGDDNMIENNLFWLADAVTNQCLDRGSDYGVVRVAGNGNQMTNNTITCEWAVANGVTVRATEGNGNAFTNCLVEDVNSDQVFLVNQYAQLTNCVAANKIKVKMEEPVINPVTANVAFVVAADSEEALDDDEKAALEWFKATCTNGQVILASQLAAADLSAFKVIWVMIDRKGIGHGVDKLPIDAQAVEALTQYYKAGGNLLLTNHATQLVVSMGRTQRSPGIFGDGDGGLGDDVWVINANIGVGVPDRSDGYDHSNHPVFNNLWRMAPYGYDAFPLIGTGHREDHNCMWDLNSYGYPALFPDAENVVNAFQEENDATVLATWGHVQDWCCAGMVEFNANQYYSGECIAIGLAAYEWNQNSGYNDYQYNIKQLTHNMLTYLAEK